MIPEISQVISLSPRVCYSRLHREHLEEATDININKAAILQLILRLKYSCRCPTTAIYDTNLNINKQNRPEIERISLSR